MSFAVLREHMEHITREGVRWDHLAWEYYGDTALLPLLLKANPAYAQCKTLPPGKTLRIPILEIDTPEPVAGLPPWRSSG